jgi:hypothetical protein
VRGTITIIAVFAASSTGCCFVPGAQVEGGFVAPTGNGDPEGAVRVGIHPPLGLQRRVDVGAGYWQDEATKYGAYGAVTAFPIVVEGHGDTFRRLGIGGQIRSANHAERGGWGGAAQVIGEVGGWGDAKAKNGRLYGIAGIGIYLEGATESVGPVQAWTAGAGVELRLPVIAGLLPVRGHAAR